jgi:hypothetical protein
MAASSNASGFSRVGLRFVLALVVFLFRKGYALTI